MILMPFTEDDKRAPPKQWRSERLLIDIDTGEIIDPNDEHKYDKIKKEITTHDRNTFIIREIQWLCRRTNQIQLFND